MKFILMAMTLLPLLGQAREDQLSKKELRLMKEKVERILEYSVGDNENHWWTYSKEENDGKCSDAQMDLKDYLSFLDSEERPYTVSEDKKNQFFRIVSRDGKKSEVSFWTKDRYRCEVNKTLFQVSQDQGPSTSPSPSLQLAQFRKVSP